MDGCGTGRRPAFRLRRPDAGKTQGQLGYDGGGEASRKTAAKVLKRLDTDGDGQVNRNEWLKSMEVFNRMDSNRDGVLTYEELRAGFVGGPKQSGDSVESHGRTPVKTGGSAPIMWIDVHVHPSIGRRRVSDARGALDAAVAAMDANHISRMVLLPQPMIDERRRGFVVPPAPIERWIDEARKYPDRFAVMGGGGSLNAMIHDDSPEGPRWTPKTRGGLNRSTQQTGRTLRMVSSSPTSVEGDC